MLLLRSPQVKGLAQGPNSGNSSVLGQLGFHCLLIIHCNQEIEKKDEHVLVFFCMLLITMFELFTDT